MTVIAPTITASEPHEYRQQMERIAPFAHRVHIDFSDGKFAPVKLINVIQAWWPVGMRADFHLMMERPMDCIETVISMQPDLVIIHAEAKGKLYDFCRELQGLGIKLGVALLQQTKPEVIKPVLMELDHVLIFSGKLGRHGGVADLSLAEKVKKLKDWQPTLEIGWDGGVDADSATMLIEAGVDVLNTGSYIHSATEPAAAYARLEEIVS